MFKVLHRTIELKGKTCISGQQVLLEMFDEFELVEKIFMCCNLHPNFDVANKMKK